MDTLTIGPRQTTVRVRHPQRGEGTLAFDNGPTIFAPDDGSEPVRVRRMGSSDGTSGSWKILLDPVHGEVRADCIGKPGPTHDRRWSPLLGAGWMVMGLPRTDDKVRAWAARFDSDDGRSTPLLVNGLWVGTPDYAARSQRSRSSKVLPMTDEENMWTTYYLADGSSIGLRKGPPDEMPSPFPAKAKSGKAKATADLPGVKP